MPEFGPIRITIPPHEVMARVLRMTSMSIASSAGLGIDQVEDVALATNEAFAITLNYPDASAITCEVEGDIGTLRIRMIADTPTPPTDLRPIEVDPLTRRVLESITDQFEHDEEHRRVSLTIGAA